MITESDASPKRQLYYTGAIVLSILDESKSDRISLMDVFQKLYEKEKVSFNLFSLTMDWLFLIDSIEIDQGIVKKCL